MSWRGIFAGSLALIALQAVVSSRQSAERVGTGLEWIANLVTAALDPSTPAIPDLTGSGAGASGSSYSSSSGGGASSGGGGGVNLVEENDVTTGGSIARTASGWRSDQQTNPFAGTGR